MQFARTAILSATLALIGTGAFAAEKMDHSVHHAATVTEKCAPGAHTSSHAGMMAHTGEMQAFHEKMMAAKTIEESHALMAEHMKSMPDNLPPMP